MWISHGSINSYNHNFIIDHFMLKCHILLRLSETTTKLSLWLSSLGLLSRINLTFSLHSSRHVPPPAFGLTGYFRHGIKLFRRSSKISFPLASRKSRKKFSSRWSALCGPVRNTGVIKFWGPPWKWGPPALYWYKIGDPTVGLGPPLSNSTIFGLEVLRKVPGSNPGGVRFSWGSPKFYDTGIPDRTAERRPARTKLFTAFPWCQWEGNFGASSK